MVATKFSKFQKSSTNTLLRSEAHVGGLLIYTQLKALGKNLGLETSTDALGQLFARKVKSELPPNDK